MTEGPEGADEGPRWRRATERKNIPHFSVNIHSRNKVDIGIRATDGALKLSSPPPRPPSSHGNNRICLQLQSPPPLLLHDQLTLPPSPDTDQHPGAFTPSSHRASTTSTANRRADVSTCRPITDCRGVEKVAEAFHSVAFLRRETRSLPPPPSLPRRRCHAARTELGSFASCNSDLHSSSLHSSFLSTSRPPFPLRSAAEPVSTRSPPSVASASLSLSRLPLAGCPERGVYKFARRNCREKYGILSANEATFAAAAAGGRELAGVSSGGSWRGYRKNRSELSSQLALLPLECPVIVAVHLPVHRHRTSV